MAFSAVVILPPGSLRSLEAVRDELEERLRLNQNGEECWALYCRLLAVNRELRNRKARLKQ